MDVFNNTTTMEFLCSEAKRIVGTRHMTAILVLETIFGILATFPNLLTIVLLWRVKVFHSNLRLLLAHLSCDLMFYSITMAEKAFRRLLTPYCQMPISFQRCVVIEWATTIPLHNAMLSLVVLLLERLYATIRFRKYDHRNHKQPYLALILAFCTLTSTLTIQLSNYSKTTGEIRIPVCETGVSLKGDQLGSIIGTFMSLEVIATGLMIFIYTYNRFILRRMVINRAQFDLSARFQVDQNVQVNTALLPSAVLHVICYLPNYTFLFFTMITSKSDDPREAASDIETRSWMLHLSFLWRIIYALVHPLLLITLSPNLKHGFQKMRLGQCFFRLIRCCGVQTAKSHDAAVVSVHVTNAHFLLLSKAWGKIERS